ncbi:MAG TPA: cyclic nucleotide-binding domain-containing protein [Terriglobia bacterium]|nr:cyclic nucleotide-binding domain-containing protein [Terriglobia bacterium]
MFSQRDAAEAVFYLQKGGVKITAISKHGKEAVIGIVEFGQFFGESKPGGRAPAWHGGRHLDGTPHGISLR